VGGPPRPTIVRAPNHLGDVVMALPALAAVPGADVMVVRWLVPILELALGGQGGRRVFPLDRGRRGWAEAVRTLRRRRYGRGLLLSPSFSAALVFAAGGVRERRGTLTDGRRLLLADPVPVQRIRGLHRSAAYYLLVADEAPEPPPAPRLPVPAPVRERGRELLPAGPGPLVGLFPGSNATSRRWDADRYAALAVRLVTLGFRVAVFGARSEMPLTARVAGSVARDLGGRTDLPLLAATLAECDLLVTNDSGPMHLAAAVGTRTLSLQGPADPKETRPLGHGHRMLRHPELPCVPCVRNECPRTGAGFRLRTAERECLRLIEVAAVEAAVHEHFSGSNP
jgi:heptosyltransferase II